MMKDLLPQTVLSNLKKYWIMKLNNHSFQDDSSSYEQIEKRRKALFEALEEDTTTFFLINYC